MYSICPGHVTPRKKLLKIEGTEPRVNNRINNLPHSYSKTQRFKMQHHKSSTQVPFAGPSPVKINDLDKARPRIKRAHPAANAPIKIPHNSGSTRRRNGADAQGPATGTVGTLCGV